MYARTCGCMCMCVCVSVGMHVCTVEYGTLWWTVGSPGCNPCWRQGFVASVCSGQLTCKLLPTPCPYPLSRPQDTCTAVLTFYRDVGAQTLMLVRQALCTSSQLPSPCSIFFVKLVVKNNLTFITNCTNGTKGNSASAQKPQRHAVQREGQRGALA